MDALENLIENIPDWLKRLEELNDQIEKRQLELAQFTESQTAEAAAASAAKSIRNKGSTESLRPRDEPEAHPRQSTPQPPAAAADAALAVTPVGGQRGSSDPQSPSSAEKRQAEAAGQARARRTLRRRQRSDSMVSAEGAAPKYRTRSMIIVYYDSYVQVFFEDLKPGDAISPLEAAAPPKEGEDSQFPTLRYMSTRRMQMQSPGLLMASAAIGRSMYSRAGRGGPYNRGMPGGLDPLKPDIYDDLDKGLEYVQSMCEHAAHQFLRDGDCAEEVRNIARRMADTKELADKEMDRVRREEPEALKAAESETRVLRPPTMRKDISLGSGLGNGNGEHVKDNGSAKEPAKPSSAPLLTADNTLEVDEGVEDMDAEMLPKLVWKSSRMMTGP